MTRPFGTKDGDKFLCEEHKQMRLDRGEYVGVPGSAAAYMMGLLPWPTGKEPCFDCLQEKERERTA